MNRLSILFSLTICLSYSLANAQIDFDFKNSTKFDAVDADNIAVGDLTGDSLDDVALGSLTSGKIIWYSNKGNKSFQKESEISITGSRESVIAIEDLNDDGDNDIIVYRSQALNILLNNGDKTFQSPLVINNVTREFTFGDFNNDKKIDIAIFTGILLGKGNGSFEGIKPFPVLKTTTSFGMQSADINKDGNLDLVTANASFGNSNDMTVLLGKGDGTFDDPTYFEVNQYPLNIAKGDFNQDGNIDFVIGSWMEEENLNIFTGKGDGDFDQRIDIKTDIDENRTLAVADLNNDGLDDILTGKNSLYLIKGDNSGSFKVDSTFNSNGYVDYIAIGNFNNDTKKDLALIFDDTNDERKLDFVFNGATTSSIRNNNIHENFATLIQNPVHDVAQIVLHKSISKINEIAVTDAQGRNVICNEVSKINNKLIIDLNNLPNGIYFILINNGVNSQCFKISKI